MEEILASIRRIIADDQSLTAHRMQPATEAVSAQPEQEKPVPSPEPVAVQPVAERPIPRVARPKFVEDREAAPSRVQRAPSAPVAPVQPASAQPAPIQPAPVPAQPEPAPQPKTDFSELQLRPQINETEEEKPVKPNPAPTFETVPSFHDTVSVPPKAVAPQDTAANDMPLTSALTESSVASSFAALFTSRLLPDEKAVAEMTRDLLRPMLKAWLDDNLPMMVERLVRAEIERVARGGR